MQHVHIPLKFCTVVILPEDQSAELATLVSHRGQAVVAHTVYPQHLGRQRQMDLCDFKTTVGYTRLIQSKRNTARQW